MNTVYCIFVAFIASYLAAADSSSGRRRSRRRSPPPPPPPPPCPPASPDPKDCLLPPKCIQGLNLHRGCLNIVQNGGHQCYKGLYVHQAELRNSYCCPEFFGGGGPLQESKAFCWCGLPSVASISPPALKYANESLAARLADAEEDNEEDNKEDHEEDQELKKTANNSVEENKEDNEEDQSEIRALLSARANKVDARTGTVPSPLNGACHNKKDGKKLKKTGKSGMLGICRRCAASCTTEEGCSSAAGSACVNSYISLGSGCSGCFGDFIHCSDLNCIEQCSCGSQQQCDHCNHVHCEPEFDHCSGLKTSLSRYTLYKQLTLPSAHGREDPLLV